MKKKEQQEQTKWMTWIQDTLKENDLTLKWLLNKISVSRSHWHFMKAGDRPMTEAVKEKIEKAMDLMINTD